MSEGGTPFDDDQISGSVDRPRVRQANPTLFGQPPGGDNVERVRVLSGPEQRRRPGNMRERIQQDEMPESMQVISVDAPGEDWPTSAPGQDEMEPRLPVAQPVAQPTKSRTRGRGKSENETFLSTGETAEERELYRQAKEELGIKSDDDPIWKLFTTFGWIFRFSKKLPDEIATKVRAEGEKVIESFKDQGQQFTDAAQAINGERVAEEIIGRVQAGLETVVSKAAERREATDRMKWMIGGLVAAVVVAICSGWIGYGMAESSLEGMYAHRMSQLPALEHAAETKEGRAWVEMLTVNAPDAIGSILGCSSDFGLRTVSVKGIDGCSGVGGHRAWRMLPGE